MKTPLTYLWRFMGFIVLSLLAPQLYELTSVSWVSRLSLDALSIAEQFGFFSLGMDVVSETATFGVLALVVLRPHDPNHAARVVRLGLLVAVDYWILFL